MEQLLTISQVAKILQVGEDWVRLRIRLGKIAAVRLGLLSPGA